MRCYEDNFIYAVIVVFLQFRVNFFMDQHQYHNISDAYNFFNFLNPRQLLRNSLVMLGLERPKFRKGNKHRVRLVQNHCLNISQDQINLQLNSNKIISEYKQHNAKSNLILINRQSLKIINLSINIIRKNIEKKYLKT